MVARWMVVVALLSYRRRTRSSYPRLALSDAWSVSCFRASCRGAAVSGWSLPVPSMRREDLRLCFAGACPAARPHSAMPSTRNTPASPSSVSLYTNAHSHITIDYPITW